MDQLVAYQFRDRHGRMYQLHTLDAEPALYLRLFARTWLWRWRPAGYVNLLWSSRHELSLCVIHIEASYRQAGVGSTVLQYLLTTARRLGAEIVTGDVTAGDFEAFPGLLAWYERHGFTVERNEPGSHPDDRRSTVARRSEWLANLRAEKGIPEAKTQRIARLVCHLSQAYKNQSDLTDT